MRRLCLALLPLLLLPASLAAQRVLAPASPVRYPLDPSGALATPLPPWTEGGSWTEEPIVLVAASALLPGAGQWLQGQRRWVPYLALEVWSWLRYREHRSNAEELARQYRDIAWSVARRVSGLPRRDTVFEYYEAMADDSFNASGLFDISLTEDGVQPEVQPGTFNGDLWILASKLFFGGGTYGPGSPQYEAALAYYRDHAIPDAYAWAWGANVLEKQVFKERIADSDEAYRNGTRVLGLIIANHIVSAVDALISARLRQSVPGNAELETGLVPEGGGVRLDARLRLHF